MHVDQDDPAGWPIVVTIHGIRTTGRWQKEFSDHLTRAKYRHVALDFGFFSAISLLMPWNRASKVEWFHQIYSERLSGRKRYPSVVAHSFGSYIVAKAMLKYDDIFFEKIILCGSIINPKYPWTDVIIKRRQCVAVLNEAGKRDFWARISEWVISDAGLSGVHGFEDDAGGAVKQIVHDQHRHSDYFYSQNYERRWVPFLQTGNVLPLLVVSHSVVNWKFRSIGFFAMVLFVLSMFHFFVDEKSRGGNAPFVSGDQHVEGGVQKKPVSYTCINGSLYADGISNRKASVCIDENYTLSCAGSDVVLYASAGGCKAEEKNRMFCEDGVLYAGETILAERGDWMCMGEEYLLSCDGDTYKFSPPVDRCR